MDKKTSKYVFAAIYGVSFVALAVGMFTLFTNFTIGKHSLDLIDFYVDAASYIFVLSIVGFVFCAIHMLFCILPCVIKYRGAALSTVVFGALTIVALVVIMIIANMPVKDDSGKYQEESYLLVSTFQTNVLQIFIPVVILTILAFIIMIKAKPMEYYEELNTEFPAVENEEQ